MKIFVSADIEGTCGIAHWDETTKGNAQYDRFARQMSNEVAAACRGALAAGADEVFVKDGHGSGRNILPELLPEEIHILRGWARNPYSMMAGLTPEYDGVIFTGYHSPAGCEENPLSHTMTLSNVFVKINGEPAPELYINSLTAAMLGVPVLMVTGDEALCRWMQQHCPWVQTVPVNKGVGSASISMHPDKAVRIIEETAKQAVEQRALAKCFAMPEEFVVDIQYKEHFAAESAHWYPGCEKLDSRTIRYTTKNWFDVLTMLHFNL